MAEKRDFKHKTRERMQVKMPEVVPDNVGDFVARLSGETDKRLSGQPDNRIDGQPSKKVRAEYKLPDTLVEMVREHAHQSRMNKSDVVAEALEAYFQQLDPGLMEGERDQDLGEND